MPAIASKQGQLHHLLTVDYQGQPSKWVASKVHPTCCISRLLGSPGQCGKSAVSKVAERELWDHKKECDEDEEGDEEDEEENHK